MNKARVVYKSFSYHVHSSLFSLLTTLFLYSFKNLCVTFSFPSTIFIRLGQKVVCLYIYFNHTLHSPKNSAVTNYWLENSEF